MLPLPVVRGLAKRGTAGPRRVGDGCRRVIRSNARTVVRAERAMNAGVSFVAQHAVPCAGPHRPPQGGLAKRGRRRSTKYLRYTPQDWIDILLHGAQPRSPITSWSGDWCVARFPPKAIHNLPTCSAVQICAKDDMPMQVCVAPGLRLSSRSQLLRVQWPPWKGLSSCGGFLLYLMAARG